MVQVSVIIPVYNCESYVATAILSVLEQGHDNLELIVVDDGSTDGTLGALHPFQNHLQIIRQENLGVAAARNRGLAIACGEFVAFLDADDWWFRSRLSAQFSALELFPEAALLFSDFCVTDAEAVPLMARGIRWKYRLPSDVDSMPWNRIFSKSQTVHWTDPAGGRLQAKVYCDNISKWLFRGNFINTSSVLVRRGVLARVSGFDESLSTEEDYDCWLKVARDWPLVYVDAPLVAFRQRAGQLTGPDQAERIRRNVAVVVQDAAKRMKGMVDQGEINARLSDLHCDIGLICLRTGRNREARHHLWQSLNQWPPQAMSLALLAFSVLPASVFGKLEQLLHVFRGRSRRATT